MPKEHAIRTRVSSSFPPYDTGIELDWRKYLEWNQNDENIEHVDETPNSEYIEQSDKSKAKEHHESKVKRLEHSSTLIFYSDGSKCEDNTADAGVYCLQENKRYFWKLGKHMEVFDTELFDIEKAFKLASSMSH
ncbi:hypothetical protein ACJ73_09581 [Blastomyces percursus]|uniref:RNase H type-1 domain-containing protein n=1 Tax=Blastomyces percursus TaxID=1658174 RepID=A0A1J9PTP6_9EURO|nr:hypothetical protein ACJ73_09581 [Blastomyces percursus]